MDFTSYFIFRSPLNSVSKKCNEHIFSEALYLSTPALYEEYKKYLSKTLTDPKELKKLYISLYKYQTRASTRCTPFGLFAGVSIGQWQTKNEIIFDSDLKKTLNRKTRLDMNVLNSLSQELIKHPFVRPHIKFYPNTSIYLIGDNYRYVEYYYANNRRFHKLNKVDFSCYLQCILKESKTGLTHSELSSLLADEEISIEDANNFVEELILSQILINQLEPTVTGEDFFDVLLNNLKAIGQKHRSAELDELISLLVYVNELIRNNDESIVNTIESYKNIHLQLKTLLPQLSETNLFQTDLYKNTLSSQLSSGLQKQLKDTVQFLNKISPPHKNNNLQDFSKRFYERYEDYEIPLLTALDSETGIGYPAKNDSGVNELVEDIFAMGNKPNESEIKWDLIQAHLFKLITESATAGKKIIEVDENDFKNIDFSKGNQPSTYSIMFKVLDANTNKIDINSIGGSSAINLLGRFAGGNKDLETIIKEIAEFEQLQMPGKIIAEIVHLPESRTGNILARPSFRQYEIPYLAKSSVQDEFQIKMDDLVLKVTGDKIILFDTRLKKEIIPRLGNAHNFSNNSLPVYHFLCDLQTQYFPKSYIGFNWGVLANQFDFLPRVEYKNTVLSPAKWQLKFKDIEAFQDKKKSGGEKIKLFSDLKSKINLPDKFLIADGDNELLIDCFNTIAIDTFIETVKNRNSVTLEEYLFNDTNALIKDTDFNSYTNECIAVVLNKNKIDLNDPISLKTFTSKKLFSIGSEWLYYKIYSGSKTADYILTEKIKQITELFLEKAYIDKWFFIRYSDPDLHLRFRLHISDPKNFTEILQQINCELEPLLNQNIISKIQTDTYRRELERYGDNSMELIETLFYIDSCFVTNMLCLLDAEGGSVIRWQMAIRSVDAFLNDFCLSTEEKYSLIDKLNTSFFNEHGGKKELKLILDNKFRLWRSKIEEVLDRQNETDKDYYPIIELIDKRSAQNKFTVSKILHLSKNKELSLSISDLLASLLHMNLDRLFMGRNRTNEFVVYDLLNRFYKTTIARTKHNAKKTEVINT